VRRFFAAVAAAWCLAVSSTALADPSLATSATAEKLFQDGKRLMEARDYAAACPKLEESQRLDPSVGTLLNLGSCYEGAGRSATAWVTFRAAAGAARVAHEAEREQFARTRADALEPGLATIAVDVPAEAAVEGLAVRRDGEALTRAAWGVAVPVDPGPHLVEAVANGRKGWTRQVSVDDRAAVRVAVPLLAVEEIAAPPSTTVLPAIPPAAPARGASHTASWIAYGAGIVGLGVGSAFGVAALSAKSDLDSHCSASHQCPTDQRSRLDTLSRDAWISNIGFGVAIVGAAVGTVLLFVKGHDEPPPDAAAGVSLQGLGMAGRF
jgi:serine/threonine-protein kinase